MKSTAFLFLMLANLSRSAWSGEIDALKVSQDIKNLGNELKLEEAEKYFQELVSSGDNW